LRLDPPLNVSASFNQTLVLSTATVEITAGTVALKIWVDATTSTVRVSVNPGPTPVSVEAVLDHHDRLTTVIDAGRFGNGK
jgi:hypothetical protein